MSDDCMETDLAESESAAVEVTNDNETKKEKRLGSCWKTMNHDREDGDGGDLGTNGLFEASGGKVIPEELMELIFSYIEIKSILSVTQVCRIWKDITTRLSFWKLVYENQESVNWSDIPNRIKEKPNSWIALYSICAHDLLRRNLIENHSGYSESATPLSDWEISGTATLHGLPARVEANPINGPPLPPDDEFGNTTSCIATTHKSTTLTNMIQLGNIGLSISVMKLLAPFTMEFSAMIGARYDYGGTAVFQIETQDNGVSLLFEIERAQINLASSNWVKVELSVYFPEVDGDDDDLLDQTHQLHFIVNTAGRREEYTEGGFYGTKVARCSAQLKLIHEPAQYIKPEDDNNPHSYTYNEKVLIERYGLDEEVDPSEYDSDYYNNYEEDEEEELDPRLN